MNLPDNYQIVNDQGIYGFFKDYRFLSNYHPCEILVDGIIYPSSEHAYMAYKTDDFTQKTQISLMEKPSDAKKLGQLITLRKDWEYYRVAAMLNCLHLKFQNSELADMLCATGGKYLEETNWWQDKFWGVYKSTDSWTGDVEQGGLNMLGKCLMIVRSNLRME
jgi:ribA/ribD-fused uncharacterized protein